VSFGADSSLILMTKRFNLRSTASSEGRRTIGIYLINLVLGKKGGCKIAVMVPFWFCMKKLECHRCEG
jgi:hypothetical protein